MRKKADEALHRQFQRLLLLESSPPLKKNTSSFLCMEEAAMEGHVIVPLEKLSLELNNGGIMLNHDKDISALQGLHNTSLSSIFSTKCVGACRN